MYLTLAIDDDAARADARLNAFIEHYYGQPAAVMRARQVNYAGPASGAAEWLGATSGRREPFVLRFAGEHERHLDAIAKVRASLAGVSS